MVTNKATLYFRLPHRNDPPKTFTLHFVCGLSMLLHYDMTVRCWCGLAKLVWQLALAIPVIPMYTTFSAHVYHVAFCNVQLDNGVCVCVGVFRALQLLRLLSAQLDNGHWTYTYNELHRSIPDSDFFLYSLSNPDSFPVTTLNIYFYKNQSA